MIQLPILAHQTATEYRLSWIGRYQEAMAEIDRQLVELSELAAKCQAEIE